MVVNTCNDYELVDCGPRGVQRAAQQISKGLLAAFPTETVYGLGANALDESAVKKIFALKNRPYSDPLIVHVSCLEMAYTLCELPDSWRGVFELLVESFWPGPLTLVVPAKTIVPKVVTGGGNTVGIRSPAHATAMELINAAGVPIAAPSANRFGHVSPTTAQHVIDDLGRDGLVVVDGGSCSVGIESTVLKIVSATECVILRRGAVSREAIEAVFSRAGIENFVQVSNRFVAKEAIQDAPGEQLVHYSPTLPTFLLSHALATRQDGSILSLANCALIDVGARYRSVKDFCGYYVDLSEIGEMTLVSELLFGALRTAESIANIKVILVPDLNGEKDELALAIADRLNRAAALKRARIINQSAQVDV